MKSSGFRILVPGTVLVDVYVETGERRLGGAEFNFAYHCFRLLGAIDFMARLGADSVGDEIRAALDARGFPSHLLQTDPSKPSKTVKVRRDARGEPRFTIPSDVASDYLAPPAWTPAATARYDLIYFGTTLQAESRSRRTVRGLIEGCDGLKFCDLNLRAPNYSRETVDYSLGHCDILKINREELAVLADWKRLRGDDEENIRRLAGQFNIGQICLTLGAEGAACLDDGRWTRARAHRAVVRDTVGAGDGFSACLAIGRLAGMPIQETLAWAGGLAAGICEHLGAVPEDDAFYTPFKKTLAAFIP